MHRLVLSLLAVSLAACGSGEPEAMAPADSAMAADSTTFGGRVRSTVNTARTAGDRAQQSVDQGQARIDSALQEAASQGANPPAP